MKLELDDDTRVFAAAVRPWLEERESENSLLLGLLAGAEVESRNEVRVRTASAEEPARFAAFYRELNLVITRGTPAVVGAAAHLLATLEVHFPGVVGPAEAATEFAATWGRLRGCHAVLAVEQRIHQLTHVIRPAEVPGAAGRVPLAEVERIAQWKYAFGVEVLPLEKHDLEEDRRFVQRRLAQGDVFGWCVEKEWVAMAMLARPTRSTVTVIGVYTPPEHRGSGYASALVAAVSEEGLRRGKGSCVLYTDLANPTSNSIYKKLGYQPVCDARHFVFRPA